MSQGVEWALHALLNLAWLDDDEPVSTAQFAASLGLTPSYLNKQLQALVRAGMLESLPGAKGGFRLTKSPEQITLMDVVSAIEGRTSAFECTEIRQDGLGVSEPASHFKQPCAIHGAMQRAELAWRQALAEQTLADVRDEADAHAKGMQKFVRSYFDRG